MDAFINPPDVLKEQARKQEAEKREGQAQSFPEQPERDVLLFLLEYAPLKPWQHDVLAIVREEAYYFAPQGQTKIMNEGWASFWHSTIMTHEDPPSLGAGRLRRPPLGHDGHPAGPAQPVQARASSCSATSRSGGTRASSARNARNATTTRSAGGGTSSSAWAARRSSRSAGSTTT